MKRLLYALFLLIATGCGHMAPVPCTNPHHAADPCEPTKCREGEVGCECTAEGCWKMTSCPAPVPGDARVSR